MSAQIHLFWQCLILKSAASCFVCFWGAIFCPTNSDSNFSLQCMVGVLWVQQYPLNDYMLVIGGTTQIQVVVFIWFQQPVY